MRGSVLAYIGLTMATLVLPVSGNAAIEPDAVAGMWLFDEGAGVAWDYSGHGNHGRISGAKHQEGQSGKALSFDGVDDVVNCGNAEILHPKLGTLTAWIFPESDDDAEHSAATLPYDDGDKWDYPFRTLGLGVNEGQVRFSITIFAVSWARNGGELSPGEWTHLAITFDGVNDTQYINGEQVHNDPNATGFLGHGNPPSTFVIGCRSIEHPDDFFKGLVDEVALFQEPLGAADVMEIYDFGLMEAVPDEVPYPVSPSGKLATTWAWVRGTRL